MAERVITVSLNIDGSQSVEELESISEAIATIEDEVRNLSNANAVGGAEEAFRELNKIVEENVLSIQELGAAADNYKNIALAAGKESPIGQEALARAAEMERRTDDLNTEVAMLAERGRNLNAALELSGTVIGGFAAFQGIQAALGVESEEFEETLIKLNAAQSALMGIEQVRAALQKGSAAQLVISNGLLKAQALLTGELTIKQAALNVVSRTTTAITGAWTKAQVFLNAVMSANPISLIIIGIGALIAAIIGLIVYFDEIVAGLKRIGQAYLKFYGIIDETDEDVKQKQIQREKDLGAERDRQLAKIDEQKNATIDAANETIKALEREREILENQGKASDEATIKILEAEVAKQQAVLDANKKKIDSYVEYYTNLAALRGQDLDEFKASMRAQGVDLDNLQERANAILEENEQNVRLAESRITKFRREQREKQAADQKAANDKEISDAEKRVQDQLALEEKLADLRVATIEDETERRRAELKLRHERELADMRERFGENTELEKLLTIKQSQEIAALEQELWEKEQERLAAQDQLDLEAQEAEDEKERLRLEQQQASIQQSLDFANQSLELATEINALLDQMAQERRDKITKDRDADLTELEENRKKDLANENLTERQRINLENRYAQQEFEIRKSAAEAEDKIAERQFKRNKGLKLAEVAINVAAGIAQALGSAPPPLSFVTAGITAALGIAQAAAISRTRFDGSAGNIQPPSFTPPNIETDQNGGVSGNVGDGDTAPTGSNLGVSNQTGIDQITGRVIVVETDITETQNTIAQIDDISTID